MATPKAHKLYRRAIKRNLAPYYPNWLPGNPQQLGNYGVIKNGIFSVIGNIKDDFGIHFDILEDPHPDNHQFDAGGSVDVDINANAEANSIAKGSLQLGFDRSNSVFFQALDARANRIKNKAQVGDQLLQGFIDKTLNWERRYVLVTDIVTAGRTVAAVSSNSGATVEFSAEGNFPEDNILGDASIGLSVKSSSKVGYIVNGQGMDILLGFSKIRRRFFWPIFEGVRATTLAATVGLEDEPSIVTESDSSELVFSQMGGVDLEDLA